VVLGEASGAAAEAEVVRSTGGREVLRNRNFVVYLVAAVVSNAGSFMQSLSVPFVLRDLTGSNTWVGIGAFAWMVPSLLMGPAAGIVSDRFDRRVVLMWSNLVQLAGALGLFALALADELTPARIIVLVVIGGLGAGFQYAAAQSLAAVLLPPHQMLDGVRLNSMGFTMSRAVGPAVAGLVLGVWGAPAAFGINALSFVVLLVALLTIRVTRVVPSTPAQKWIANFRDGIRYVRRREALRLVVMSAFVGAFFGQSMVQLAAGLAEEDFDVGGGGLGLLVAVYGVGSTAASFALVRGGDRLQRSRMARTGLALFGVGLLLTVVTSSFVLGLVGFLVAGTAHGFTNISLNTAVQAQVHESYRGRALSVFLMALLAGMPFGALAGGALGDAIGLRPTLALFAAAVFGYLAFVTYRRQRLALLDGVGPIELEAVPDAR
jgi:MFS family permease